MHKTVISWFAEILWEYHRITGKTFSEMSLDFEVTPSNLYTYRDGRGNPTAKTMDKVLRVIKETCPEVLENIELKL